MPRYRMTVAYDGTAFHGWQKQQPPNDEPLRTVQGVLEQTLRQVVREDVGVVGASRTDSGVHAIGQVAAFDTIGPLRIPLERFAAAVNARLPDDVQVQAIAETHESFNPIGDAVAKGYRYRFAHGMNEGVLPPLFDRHFVNACPYRLDAQRMNEAAQHLIGEYDFASLTRLDHGRESTVRTIFDCTVTDTSPDRLHIEVSGSGFLYNMVRIIAGTLMEVGRGRLEPDAIAGILAARDRRAAGPTLPPEGLCLMWIRYPAFTTETQRTQGGEDGG